MDFSRRAGPDKLRSLPPPGPTVRLVTVREPGSSASSPLLAYWPIPRSLRWCVQGYI